MHAQQRPNQRRPGGQRAPRALDLSGCAAGGVAKDDAAVGLGFLLGVVDLVGAAEDVDHASRIELFSEDVNVEAQGDRVVEAEHDVVGPLVMEVEEGAAVSEAAPGSSMGFTNFL